MQHILDSYHAEYERQWHGMLTQKLGLAQYDATLADELQAILPLVETDMTLFYRALANVDAEAAGNADDARLIAPLMNAYYDPAQLTDDYRQRPVA